VTVLPPTPISAIGVPPAAGTPAGPAGAEGMGKDTFLKLLVAQLKYQDPSNPADGATFMAQTAQFTQVEKLEDIAAAITQSVQAQSLFGVGALIGRTVSWTAADGSTLSGAVGSATFSAAGPVLQVGADGTTVPLSAITAIGPTPSS
jgi:flagellar basal-body rod modification protein FlgD